MHLRYSLKVNVSAANHSLVRSPGGAAQLKKRYTAARCRAVGHTR